MNEMLLAAALTLTAADWAQTRQIQRYPGAYELNPLLGRLPSAGQVNRYFAICAVSTVALSYTLPPRYSERFLKGMIIVEGLTVARNHYIGLRVQF